MKYTQGQYAVSAKTKLAEGIYSFEIVCPDVCAVAVPGQFAHIKVEGSVLRRPISICGIDRENDILRLIIEIRGQGTAKIVELEPGDKVDMLAPLGHGFTINPDFKKVVLIGGGIGTPPMLPIAQVYGEKSVAITGFRNEKAAILQDDFAKTGAEVILCTDDGSAGIHGFVTQPLKELAEAGGIDAVYACGPMPMLRGVAAICRENGIFCQVSLEERMACGIGACLGCACRTVRNDEEYYAHVCKDGPVFNAEEVLW
ncbi:MAG: dihydroorotate dehydrogenase electron transfer subunit [Ruminococcus sp.]|nr:dihydroorotate dehydrogenase electron transfer subunit [Ruminococcus sp.]